MAFLGIALFASEGDWEAIHFSHFFGVIETPFND